MLETVSPEWLRKSLREGSQGTAPWGEHCFWESRQGKGTHPTASTDECKPPPGLGRSQAGVTSLAIPWPFSQLAFGPAQLPTLGLTLNFFLLLLFGN